MTLQSKLQYVGQAFAAAVTNAYHYFRPADKWPCLVWQEDGEGDSLHAGNHKAEQAIHGTVDYYTQTEYDPAVDAIQDALEGIRAGWSLASVQYEEDTRLIHFEWEWTVAEVHVEENDG